MTFLAVTGALFLTALLVFATIGYVQVWMMRIGFAGLNSLAWQDWIIALIALAALALGWYFWWLLIGANITISFG